VACIIEGERCGLPRRRVPADVHHEIVGGRRTGHDRTMPLCPYHHTGRHGNSDMTDRELEAVYGPSLAHGSKAFHRAYGSNSELIDRTNVEIEKVKERVANGP